MRRASIERNTKETQIRASLTVEGRGKYDVSTGVRFFDHMLELFTKHGGFDLKLVAKGDLDVDQHHTVEDVGIVLGQLFAKALGDRRGINRAGYFVLPMDETLAVVAVDLGGRPALVYKDLVKTRLVGDLQTELVQDFFDGFVNHAGANLHAKVLYGRSNHHKIEAIFKCFARAMRYACSKDARLKK
ncbi:MAG TPA: imidazoleglycerol-phosphate dehydratase HisB, partial [Bryobacteraceae bacterium]